MHLYVLNPTNFCSFSIGIQINAYIHCFVGVRKITSLYDLELAICKNENIQQFEELGLGPLLLHPLVLHYFQVSSDTTEVFKITSEEIVFLLIGFQTHKREVTDDSVEEFLDFIVKRRSVASKEMLGIRICSLGYVSHFSLLLCDKYSLCLIILMILYGERCTTPSFYKNYQNVGALNG